MKDRFACVGDVRSIGLFSVIELVKDQATREPLAPFNGSSPQMVALAKYLRQNYLYAFTRFNMLWVCPPLIITQQQLGEGLTSSNLVLPSSTRCSHRQRCRTLNSICNIRSSL